ncbi:DUF397 domain-containing protein [Streptomyces iranensis]|uniref:DUF397 domain-containing protein n=1 Tax=Streptomyces iranensis TaxID=576784 RepID=UPI0039B730A7
MDQLNWQKSSFSEGHSDTCMEVATDPIGTPHLRESDDPHTVITTTPTALRALLRTIKTGALDRLDR